LAATDRGQLHCIGADGQSRWSVSVGKGRLTGAPLMIDGEVALASTSGDVTRINLDDGRQTADLNLGEPLGAAPVPFLGKLLLTGSDGTVYIASWAEAPAS
jgi:outer membrane protein assembly factor BamB